MRIAWLSAWLRSLTATSSVSLDACSSSTQVDSRGGHAGADKCAAAAPTRSRAQPLPTQHGFLGPGARDADTAERPDESRAEEGAAAMAAAAGGAPRRGLFWGDGGGGGDAHISRASCSRALNPGRSLLGPGSPTRPAANETTMAAVGQQP